MARHARTGSALLNALLIIKSNATTMTSIGTTPAAAEKGSTKNAALIPGQAIINALAIGSRGRRYQGAVPEIAVTATLNGKTIRIVLP
jgi:hypothetical protein